LVGNGFLNWTLFEERTIGPCRRRAWGGTFKLSVFFFEWNQVALLRFQILHDGVLLPVDLYVVGIDTEDGKGLFPGLTQVAIKELERGFFDDLSWLRN
jgi:hypothetical protein